MTTKYQAVCAHRDCDVELHTTDADDGRPSCSEHWRELPLSLRTRIASLHHGGQAVEHRAAVIDAIRYWNPRTRDHLRCHHCKTATDWIDEVTGLPECVDCAKTELDQTAGRHSQPTDTLTCPECHRDTGMLISVDDGPELCPACRTATR